VRYGALAPQPSIVSSNDAPTEAEEPLSITEMKLIQVKPEDLKSLLPWQRESLVLTSQECLCFFETVEVEENYLYFTFEGDNELYFCSRDWIHLGESLRDF
tara:strand:- start:350 stop:652 length:303 start_codon:yes stop_codon:yes gene_type:complete